MLISELEKIIADYKYYKEDIKGEYDVIDSLNRTIEVKKKEIIKHECILDSTFKRLERKEENIRLISEKLQQLGVIIYETKTNIN